VRNFFSDLIQERKIWLLEMEIYPNQLAHVEEDEHAAMVDEVVAEVGEEEARELGILPPPPLVRSQACLNLDSVVRAMQRPRYVRGGRWRKLVGSEAEYGREI